MDKIVYELIDWLNKYNAADNNVKLILEFDSKGDYCQADRAFKHEWAGGHPFDRKINGIPVEFRTRPTHGS